MIDKALKRRDILAMSAAAICLGASASAAPMAKSIDFTDPVKRLRAFMLMRGALDDRLVVGCMTGRYYGVVDDESMPLFGLASATFARFRPAADGGFEGASYEVPFFTDLTTGAALEQFVNPYTGETVTVPQSALPPSRIAISPDFVVTTPGAPPRLEYKHRILPPITSGDDVWMVEETFSAIQSPTRPKPPPPPPPPPVPSRCIIPRSPRSMPALRSCRRRMCARCGARRSMNRCRAGGPG